MIDGNTRRRVPATPLCVATERHEAHVSAFRTGREPSVDSPSIFKMALAVVVRRGALDIYRRGLTS